MHRPRTKPALAPFRLPNGDILLARDVFGLGRRIRHVGSGVLWDLLGLLDGTRHVAIVTEVLQGKRPAWRRRDTERLVAQLERIGVVEEAAGPSPLSPSEAERYSRNLDFFSLVTVGTPRAPTDPQLRLRAARVTILGMGAIGTATAMSLAAAGVGRMTILDPDRVELSNLNRQLLYRTSDVGRWKVDAAAEHLRELNPNLRVTKKRFLVRAARELRPLLRGCDLFVLGADRPHEILHWANDAAVAEGTAWLDNSYSGPRCAIALFVPGRTPCLRCLEHHLERQQRRERVFVGTSLLPETAGNAVIAPTAGIAGHFGALRAIYFLAGLRHEDDGALVALNLWALGEDQVVRPRFWRSCPACGSRPRTK